MQDIKECRILEPSVFNNIFINLIFFRLLDQPDFGNKIKGATKYIYTNKMSQWSIQRFDFFIYLLTKAVLKVMSKQCMNITFTSNNNYWSKKNC